VRNTLHCICFIATLLLQWLRTFTSLALVAMMLRLAMAVVARPRGIDGDFHLFA
jgi:hypothetical protein